MRALLRLVPFVILAAVACGGPATPPAPPFETVATSKELMNAVLDPAVDVIWDSVGSVITAEGTFEKAPETDDDWAAVRASAVLLAESGNLLMLGDRAGGSPEWIAQAQALIEVSKRTIQVIDKKDTDALFTIGGDIYDVCTNCHRQFALETVRQ